MPFTSENNPSTGRKKGAKNKATLKQEERRAIFDEHISQKFLKVVDKARPEYVLDQFIGKAVEKHEHKLNFGFEDDDTLGNLVE